MMVGVGPCFYGFTLDGVQEEDVSIHWTGVFTFLGKFLYGFLVCFKIFDTWRPQFFLNHHRISVILQSTTSWQ